jgi:hypothetical protein
MGPSVQFHISCNLPPTLDDFTLPHQLPFSIKEFQNINLVPAKPAGAFFMEII